jgi:hypothetical protein
LCLLHYNEVIRIDPGYEDTYLAALAKGIVVETDSYGLDM